MAKLGRPKAYYPFRNRDKTYKRYKKLYFKKARSKFKKEWKRMSNEDKQEYIEAGLNPKRPTQKVLQNFMEDDLLSKTDFAEDYRNYKRDLIDEGKETSDPIQYIVQDQAYKCSYKQYLGFKKAVETEDFYGITGLDLRKVKKEEFMTGRWQDQAFFDALDKFYWEMKAQAEAEGKTGKVAVREARNKVAELAFGRDENAAFWGDSK